MIEIIARDIDDNAIAGVVQWDRDVRIYLSDKGISQPYQVHMFNNFSKEALVVDTEFKDGRLCAKIPNDLLIQPLPIIGFVNVTENDEARCTYCFKINMRKKPKPSDYVHKDSNDYVSVGEIRDECKKYAEEATKAAEQASESASKAEESANSAEQSKKDAETEADRSEKAADRAETAAQQAEAAKINVVQTTGESTTDVMSQKAVSDKFTELENDINDNKVTIVQTTGTSETDVMSQKAVTDKFTELDNKVEEYKVNVVQTRGESTEDVMSQNAVTEELVKLEEADVGRKSSFDATSEIFNSYDGEDANAAGTELEEEQTAFYAHAEGYGNSALAKGSHAEGHGNTIENGCDNSHAEGDGNSITQGSTNSHVGGKGNQVQGASENSAIFGSENTVVASDNAIVAGRVNKATNCNGNIIAGVANEVTGVSYDSGTMVSGNSITAMGNEDCALFGGSHSVNGCIKTLVSGIGNKVNLLEAGAVCGRSNEMEEVQTQTTGNAAAFVFGQHNVFKGGAYLGTMVQGLEHKLNGVITRSFVGGRGNTINQISLSFVYGDNNTISGASIDNTFNLMVLGAYNTVNPSTNVFVAGTQNKVNGGNHAHTIGYYNELNGDMRVSAIGNDNVVNGSQDTCVLGYHNEMIGNHSSTVGEENIIHGGQQTNSFGHHLKQELATNQVAVGQYNKNDYTSGYVFIVGCGTDEENRKNAIEVSNTKVVINNDVTINGTLEGYATKEDIANIAGNSTFVSVSYVDGAINVTEDSGINEVTKTYTDEEPFVLYDGTNRNKGYTAHFTWTNAGHTKNAEIIGFVRPTGTVVVFNGVISELGSDIVLYADDSEEIGTISINEDRVLSFNFTGDRTSLKMEGYITSFRQGGIAAGEKEVFVFDDAITDVIVDEGTIVADVTYPE